MTIGPQRVVRAALAPEELPPLDAEGMPVEPPLADLNPQLAMNMACTLFGLTPEEALAGMTINAARALGLGDRDAVGDRIAVDDLPGADPQDGPVDGGHPVESGKLGNIVVKLPNMLKPRQTAPPPQPNKNETMPAPAAPPGRPRPRADCAARRRPAGTALLHGLSAREVEKAACELGVSRETLARALATPRSRERFTRRYGIDDAKLARAIRAGSVSGPCRKRQLRPMISFSR